MDMAQKKDVKLIPNESSECQTHKGFFVILNSWPGKWNGNFL